jgi:hypothetical protein
MMTLDELWHTVWWSYARDAGYAWSLPYRYFSYAEGLFWWGIAIYVFMRWYKNRQSSLEFCYVLSFVAFGATDFREAIALETWLILVKGINLGVILVLRHYVLKYLYPSSKYSF